MRTGQRRPAGHHGGAGSAHDTGSARATGQRMEGSYSREWPPGSAFPTLSHPGKAYEWICEPVIMWNGRTWRGVDLRNQEFIERQEILEVRAAPVALPKTTSALGKRSGDNGILL